MRLSSSTARTRKARAQNRFRFELLEDRRLLATFSESSGILQIDLVAGESLEATSTGASYNLALTSGTFSGINSANVTGNSTASLSVLAAAFTEVKIDDSGTGVNVNFANSGANTYTSSFTVTLDSTAPGFTTFAGTTTFIGSASLFLQSGGINGSPGASISTVNGNLTLRGNMQSPGLTGNVFGLFLNDTQVRVNGTGNLTLTGKSGISTTSTVSGVRLQGSTVIAGGTAGSTLTIEGYGAASSTRNYGVNLSGSGSITTLGGNVVITGSGGTGSAGANKGVLLEANTSILATGSGSITVIGNGGGNGSSQNNGIEMLTGTQIASVNGSVSVTGTGGGGATGNANRGVFVAGSIKSTGSGAVNVTGTGGPGSGGDNQGVLVERSNFGTVQEIKSGSGDVNITGTAGGGGGSLGIKVNSVSGAPATLSTNSPGTLRLTSDSMSLVTSAVISAPSVTIAPKAAGKNIDVGSTSDTIANTLSLSQAELNTISAGRINLGDSNTANITVSANITLSQSTGVNFSATTVNFGASTVAAGAVAQNGVGPAGIGIAQPVTNPIADGGSVALGNVLRGATKDLVFTISNPGFSDLTGLGITIDGPNASEFSVVAAAVAPVVPLGSTTFTIRFAPTSFGSKSAALHIANNVPGANNPFDINFTGFSSSTAAIIGTKSIGPTGDYTSLTIANMDLQLAGIAGPVILELQPAYVSSAETFPLVFSNFGTTATNTLTIRPQVGAAGLSINSAAAQTVDLNGAQFVTFDGRPGGLGTAKELTIENTSTAGVAVRFINEASNNTLKFVTLRGVNTSATSGVVVLSTTTGASGNDNNTLDNCDIRDGASTPRNGIYSVGSTGSIAQNNSGNAIINSNVFNFDAAANVDAAGVRLDGGNDSWTITGNSFYQTATRTTVGGNVRAIYVNNTSGNNFSVTGNFIGGDTSRAEVTTQKWTTTGTGGNRFVGIQLNVGTSTPSSVQGNAIANIVWTTGSGFIVIPGVWTGIYVQAGNVNIGTVTGNTIGSGMGTGSISVTSSDFSSTSYGIASASPGTVAISNNTIGSITVISPVTGFAASLTGIAVTAGTNAISNNLVGSTTIPSPLTGNALSLNAATFSTSTFNLFEGAQQVTGILATGGSASITGNTVANLNNNHIALNLYAQTRGIVTSGVFNSVTANTVRNLSTSTANLSTGSSASVIGIANTSTVSGHTLSLNTVHSLNNTADSEVSVTGIYFGGSGGSNGTSVISGNFVHSLAMSSTNANSQLLGMHFGSGSFTVQNNMVRVGIKADGTSTAGASIVRGIYDNAATAGRNFYHNSVYVGGTQTLGASNTRAFDGTIGASNARAYQNNIFVNARSNSGSATAKHYAVQYGGTTVNPTGLKAGGNLLYVPNTASGGVLGVFNGADRSTLAAWQIATGQDVTSGVGDPLFVNPTGDVSSVDLHLQPSNPAEGQGITLTDALAGTNVTVTGDFDGQTRSTLTPADVGADAGSFTLSSDVFAPVVSYPLLTSSSTANRVLTGWASIRDIVGLSGGANAPRLYFKKSTDADVFGVANDSTGNGWKYVTGTDAGGGSYSFTLDYSLINGGSVIIGDTVQYFVVAQDDANNLGSSPIAAAGSGNPPVQSINAKPLAGVNSFNIVSTISGTTTVGIGGDYPSLTGAGGLFAAINASVLTGNLTVNITSDLTETGAVTLSQWLEESTGNYKLTIKPDRASVRTISGNSPASLITLNGADRVTIDGSFGGSGRYLTFRNTDTGNASSTIRLQNDSSNNTIRNCVVEGASIGANGVINVGTGTVTGNDNNVFIANQVRDRSDFAGVPLRLIVASGSVFPASNSGNTISNNELFNFNGTGISIGNQGDENWTISGNNIYEVNAASNTSVRGIEFFGTGNGTSLITGNHIHDLIATSGQSIGIVFFGAGTATISGNRVTAFNVTANTDVRGITAQGSAGSTVNIVNNQITLIPATSGSTSLYGLFDNGTAGSVVNVFHNSIVIGGTETGSRNSWASYRNQSDTHTSRNNLFLNLRTGGTRSHFAAGREGTGGTYIASHNVYAGTGATAANFMDFSSSNGTAVPVSFATWQTRTGDTNSQAGIAGSGNFTNAMFVSASTGDLHLIPGGNVLVNGTGTPIAGVTTDYDGDLRSLTAPVIGADEILFNTAPTSVILTPSSVSLSENANTTSAIELSSISYTDDGNGTNTLSLSGSDADSFEIVAGKLRLKPGVTLDFDTKPTFSVRVNVDDATVGGTPDAFADFTLNISEPPTTVYVDDGFTQTIGMSIADADLGTDGNQPAIIGVNAFASITAAISAGASNATIIVNDGTYAEAVSPSGTQQLRVTGSDSAQLVTINSITTSVGQTIQLHGSSNLTVGDASNRTIAGPVSGTGSVTKAGTGQLRLTGINNYTGLTTVDAGELNIGSLGSGSITSNVLVNAGGRLTGGGIINGNVSGSGFFSPNMVMTINGNFSPTGTVEFLVNRTYATPGADFDQFVVNGTVNLTDADLTFVQTNGGSVAILPSMLLIDNNLSDSITTTGTAPLAGMTFTFQGHFYQLSYAGGSGNDVVLNQVSGVLYDSDTDKLTVYGSNGNDSIRIQETSPGVVEVRGSFGDLGSTRVSINTSTQPVSSINLLLYDGNNVADVRVSMPTLIVGGAGNDSLRRSGGVGILVGGGGNDSLRGTDQSVILIGGDGSDALIGSDSVDLLIGGMAANELNYSALQAALADLFANDLVAAKAKLGTVTDDSDIDDILGRGGLDDILFGAGDRWIQ